MDGTVLFAFVVAVPMIGLILWVFLPEIYYRRSH